MTRHITWALAETVLVSATLAGSGVVLMLALGWACGVLWSA